MRKYHNRSCRSFVLATVTILLACMGGCELDPIIVACGTEDDPLKGFILNDPMQPVSSKDDLSGEERLDKIKIATYVQNNRCPDSWFCTTVYDPDSENGNGYACSQCAQSGYIQCGGYCVDMYHDRENCGACGKTCQDWEACESGDCVETRDCDPGYHAYHGDCEVDSLAHCGSHANDCDQSTGWVSGTCEDGQCVVSECADDYALLNGTCVYRLLCQAGNHQYGDSCEANTVENCGTHGSNCSAAVGWEDGYCSEKGNCVPSLCKDGFEIIDNQCVPITECPEHTHFYAGACEPDSLEHCGMHGNRCLDELAWEDGECSASGKCVVRKCSFGYCVENTVCQDGSYNKNACGTEGGECVKCGTGQICKAGRCIDSECDLGEHKSGTVCVKDDMENCGLEGYACAIANANEMKCDKGNCVVLSCNTGYHIYGNTCEADTAEHCGVHDNACKSIIGDWESGSCVDRKCIPDKCIGGHPYEAACERDSVENCGAHGKACAVDHAEMSCEGGYCRIIRCEKNYYLSLNGEACENSVSHNKAYVEEATDPWGLVWDSDARKAEPYISAMEMCARIGARLPTLTELARNVYASGRSNLANTDKTDKLWSAAIGGVSKAITMDLAKGGTELVSATSSRSFRCVWDVEPRPITFSGANCHGEPGKDGCQILKIGKMTYIVDSEDRYKQRWFSAAQECRMLGARLPYLGEFGALVRAGWTGGTKAKIWTEAKSGSNGVAPTWSGTDKTWDYTKNSLSTVGLGSETPFRCVSELVKLDDDEPVFPQPKAKDAFVVAPLLRIDSKPRQAANYWNASLDCFKDGGHIARADELSDAIRAGLPKPDASTYYLTGTTVGSYKCLTMKWGSSPADVRLYYGGDGDHRSSVETLTAKPYFCAYRPARDYEYSHMDYLKTNDELISYDESGVTHYVRCEELEKAHDLFTKANSANEYGMWVARDDELLYVLGRGVSLSTSDKLMTSGPTTNSDGALRMRGLYWDGKKDMAKANYGLVGYDKNAGHCAYASTVIH